ncbi:unnamed protein product [Ectocarpus sp. 13 AM-2016]
METIDTNVHTKSPYTKEDNRGHKKLFHYMRQERTQALPPCRQAVMVEATCFGRTELPNGNKNIRKHQQKHQPADIKQQTTPAAKTRHLYSTCTSTSMQK